MVVGRTFYRRGGHGRRLLPVSIRRSTFISSFPRTFADSFRISFLLFRSFIIRSLSLFPSPMLGTTCELLSRNFLPHPTTKRTRKRSFRGTACSFEGIPLSVSRMLFYSVYLLSLDKSDPLNSFDAERITFNLSESGTSSNSVLRERSRRLSLRLSLFRCFLHFPCETKAALFARNERRRASKSGRDIRETTKRISRKSRWKSVSASVFECVHLFFFCLFVCFVWPREMKRVLEKERDEGNEET